MFRNDQQQGQGPLSLQYSDNLTSNYYRPYNDHDDILRKLDALQRPSSQWILISYWAINQLISC